MYFTDRVPSNLGIPIKNSNLTILYILYILYTMPQVTVYIRKEDLALWKAVKEKSEWMHRHLNYTPLKYIDKQVELPKNLPLSASPDGLKAIALGKSYSFCKHDQVKGMCKKGCR